MHKVFRISKDVTHFQYMLATKKHDRVRFTFDCEPIKASWEPPQMRIWNPKKKPGAFFHFFSDHLIANSKANELLKDWFDESGETLELSCEGEVFYVLNVLRCQDCLDVAKTQWMEGLENITPEKYEFSPENLPSRGLFKIPQTQAGEILLHTDTDLPANEDFKHVVERSDLAGLQFTLLWTNGS